MSKKYVVWNGIMIPKYLAKARDLTITQQDMDEYVKWFNEKIVPKLDELNRQHREGLEYIAKHPVFYKS